MFVTQMRIGEQLAIAQHPTKRAYLRSDMGVAAEGCGRGEAEGF